MENIEGIKIMHIDGLNNAIGRGGAGGGNGGGDGGGNNGGGGSNLAEQVVDSALRYRAQVPLIESLLGEVGLKGGSLNDMTRGLHEEMFTGTSSVAPKKPAPLPAREREQPAMADDDDDDFYRDERD
jgi:hypothetical protein